MSALIHLGALMCQTKGRAVDAVQEKFSSPGALYACFNAHIHTCAWCQLQCGHCEFTECILTHFIC